MTRAFPCPRRGISADLGLHGLHVHAESLKALLSGGVAFATPPKPGHPVSAGSVFKLHAEAKQDDPSPEPTHEEHKHHFLHGLFHHGG